MNTMAIVRALRETLSWGMTYGHLFSAAEWEVEREKQVRQHLEALRKLEAPPTYKDSAAFQTEFLEIMGRLPTSKEVWDAANNQELKQLESDYTDQVLRAMQAEDDLRMVTANRDHVLRSNDILRTQRNSALKFAVERVTTLYEGKEPPYLVDICRAIEDIN